MTAFSTFHSRETRSASRWGYQTERGQPQRRHAPCSEGVLNDEISRDPATVARSHLRVTRSEQAAITDFVLNGRPATWKELCDRVHPSDRPRAEAVLANAIALGRIRVDRNATIHDGTVVTPIDPSTSRAARD